MERDFRDFRLRKNRRLVPFVSLQSRRGKVKPHPKYRFFFFNVFLVLVSGFWFQSLLYSSGLYKCWQTLLRSEPKRDLIPAWRTCLCLHVCVNVLVVFCSLTAARRGSPRPRCWRGAEWRKLRSTLTWARRCFRAADLRSEAICPVGSSFVSFLRRHTWVWVRWCGSWQLQTSFSSCFHLNFCSWHVQAKARGGEKCSLKRRRRVSTFKWNKEQPQGFVNAITASLRGVLNMHTWTPRSVLLHFQGHCLV